jgi:recombination protein RecR
LQTLIHQLRKLPGVGGKTAERYAFRLIEWEKEALLSFAKSLEALSNEIQHCPTCFCLKGDLGCDFCNESKRDTSMLCIVSHAKDIYPIEETKAFHGLYHVLGGVFSPLHGKGVEEIDLSKIYSRIQKHDIKDVLLALDSTLEGDATSLFLKEQMESWNVSISRLAFGIPVGSSLDYVDPGTLTRALLGRHRF